MRVAPEENVLRSTRSNPEEKRRASGMLSLMDHRESNHCFRSLRLHNSVLSLPPQVQGKFLCKGTDIIPCDEEGSVVKLTMELKKGRCCLRKGNISIQTMAGEPYAGGVSIFDYRRPCLKNGMFVLKDKEGKPLAMCQQSRPNLNTRAYVICGRTPISKVEEEQAKAQGQFKFYPWYRIVSYNMGPFENRAISVWDGGMYKPFLKVKVASATMDKIAVSSLEEDSDFAILQKARKGKDVVWEVTVAAGADPGLMLCIAAVVEDFSFS